MRGVGFEVGGWLRKFAVAPIVATGVVVGLAGSAAIAASSAPATVVLQSGSLPVGGDVVQGACGSWYEEKTNEFGGIAVCTGTEGSTTRTGAPRVDRRFVDIDVYRCGDSVPAGCEDVFRHGTAGVGDLTIDPLLRTATLHTIVQGCAVSVKFLGGSDLVPVLDQFTFQSLGHTMAFGAGVDGATYRDAHWTGTVCGTPIGGSDSFAQLFRAVGGGVFVRHGRP